MKGNSVKKWGPAVGTFAAGAAAGSILALLYAPASGKMTRKKIGMKFRALGQSTNRQIKMAKKVLLKKAEGLREAAGEKFGQTRDWLVERVANGNGKKLRRRLVHHA